MAGIGSEPAYPAPEASKAHFGAPTSYMGLTKREHFAGLAMQALIAEAGPDAQMHDMNDAVTCADALLGALNRPGRIELIETALRRVVAEFDRLGIPEGAESEMLRQCREALE